MNNLDRFVDSPDLITEALDWTKRKYRPLDPGWYLYRQLVKTSDLSKKFADDFVELVYVTLCAWNMNSRGAKLAEWDSFRKSIFDCKDDFIRLESYRLEVLAEGQLEWILNEAIPKLFSRMSLVAPNKPRLVTYSKVFHFYLPNLFVPIDRKYTLTYFYGNAYVPPSLNKQIERFSQLLREFQRFAHSVRLADKMDTNWNANVPKIIDNMIIGFQAKG